MKHIIRTFFAITALGFPIAAAADGDLGDIQKGKNLAREVCAKCHLVEEADRSDPLQRVPSFQEVAYMPSTTALSLRVFLRSPHKNMPNLILPEAETAAVIAYILSLK